MTVPNPGYMVGEEAPDLALERQESEKLRPRA